jgi:hypothetical protein
MTMEPLDRLKVPSANISELKFSQDDTCLAAICSDGFMQRWTMELEKKDHSKNKGVQIVDGKKIGADGKPLSEFKEYQFPKLGEVVIERSC